MRYCILALTAVAFSGIYTENLAAQTAIGTGHRSTFPAKRASYGQPAPIQQAGAKCGSCGKGGGCKSGGCGSSHRQCGRVTYSWGCRCHGGCYPKTTILSEMACDVKRGVEACVGLVKRSMPKIPIQPIRAKSCRSKYGGCNDCNRAPLAPATREDFDLAPPPPIEADPFQDDRMSAQSRPHRLPGPAGQFVKRASYTPGSKTSQTDTAVRFRPAPIVNRLQPESSVLTVRRTENR